MSPVVNRIVSPSPERSGLTESNSAVFAQDTAASAAAAQAI